MFAVIQPTEFPEAKFRQRPLGIEIKLFGRIVDFQEYVRRWVAAAKNSDEAWHYTPRQDPHKMLTPVEAEWVIHNINAQKRMIYTRVK